MEFREALVTKRTEAGLSFSPLQVEQLQKYYEMLVETNKVMNLTAITEPEDVAIKHMIDSLLVYDAQLFAGKKLADVGTGAGLPGLPLKIYCPSLEVVLIDSLAKRVHFLEQVITQLGLEGISCVHLRAEEAGQSPLHRGQYDIVVARAVAALPVLTEYCLPLVKTGGYFFALKGSKYAEEAQAAEHAITILGGTLESAQKVKLPGLDDGRGIIKIKKVKATPKQYPRKAGLPSKNSL